MQGTVHIGTSGWSYDHWDGPFYPPGLPARRRLEHYSRFLGSVEIDSSFYRLPSAETLAVWRESVPAGFVFAAKASRYLTHLKKLKDSGEGLERCVRRMAILGDRLGPILFQLPPRWRFNEERLAGFLAALSGDFRYAFELRDPSWLCDGALELLAQANVSFCVYELDGFVSPKSVTADFVYVRLHGPDGPYRGDYTEDVLSGWADSICTWRSKGLDVYFYFDNDEAGFAAKNAMTLRSILRGVT